MGNQSGIPDGVECRLSVEDAGWEHLYRRRIVSRKCCAGGRAGRGGSEVLVEGLKGDIRMLERKA